MYAYMLFLGEPSPGALYRDKVHVPGISQHVHQKFPRGTTFGSAYASKVAEGLRWDQDLGSDLGFIGFRAYRGKEITHYKYLQILWGGVSFQIQCSGNEAGEVRLGNCNWKARKGDEGLWRPRLQGHLQKSRFFVTTLASSSQYDIGNM